MLLHGGMIPTGDTIDLTRAAQRHRSLIERIHQYDPALVIYHDSAVGRYGIARMTPGGTRFIALWQHDKTGAPLPMDNRLYEAIVSWDLRPPTLDAANNADAYCDRLERADAARSERVDQEFDGDIGHLTKSNRRSLNRVIEAIR